MIDNEEAKKTLFSLFFMKEKLLIKTGEVISLYIYIEI